MKWQSLNNKNTSHQLDLERFRVTVTRHIDHDPNTWLCSVHGDFDVSKFELESEELANAKLEALTSVLARVFEYESLIRKAMVVTRRRGKQS